MDRVIEDRLQRLLEKMKVVGYKEHWIRLTKEYVNGLQQGSVYCVDRFIRRLERSTKGKDQREYWDILMEGRFAVILARNGFLKIHVEYSDEGPDIKANWNRNAIYFEVTRKRSKADEWVEQPENVELPSNKTDNIIDKIDSKLGQLKLGEINIVVFWSSTVAVLESEMEEAVRCIKQKIADDPEKYNDLSGVLFTEDGGVDVATLKQFRLFKNEKALNPVGTRLAKKLKSLHERNSKQLQRECEELAAALKQQYDKRKQLS